MPGPWHYCRRSFDHSSDQREQIIGLDRPEYYARAAGRRTRRRRYPGNDAVVERAGPVDADREARRIRVSVAVGHLHDEVELLIGRRLALRGAEAADVELARDALNEHGVVQRRGLPLDLVASVDVVDHHRRGIAREHDHAVLLDLGDVDG